MWRNTICLEKRKFEGGAGAGYQPSESNNVKVWRQPSGFLLAECCGWVVILGSACVEMGSLGKGSQVCG